MHTINPNITQVLVGHTSFETAYIIPDYPSGFVLRCKKAIWVESKPKRGQRVVYCTSNPRKNNEVWCNDKASTYSDIIILALDDKGHVAYEHLTFYASLDEMKAYEAAYGAFFDDYQKRTIAAMMKARARADERAKHEVWTINGQPVSTPSTPPVQITGTTQG